MKSALEKLKKYKIEFDVHDDVYNEEGEDILEKLSYEIKQEVEDNYDKLKKSKFCYPLHILIFDDFPQILKLRWLSSFIKTNRHLRWIVLIWSQYYNDLEPMIRCNLNYLILYNDIPLNKLKTIYDEKIRWMTFERFLEIYYETTKETYNFLYINTDNMNDIRKNFNIQILI